MRYIERDSIHYARAATSRIVAIAESIPEHPELSRMVPEIDDPIVHKYRLIYPLESERILMAVAIHGHQEFESQIPRVKGAS